MRRIVAIASVVLSMLPFTPRAMANEPCTPRMLVLSAFPGEIDALLAETQVAAITGDGFAVGTLRGNDVVLALTGIGLLNAERTTQDAIDSFRCDGASAITEIVFSGVAGGRSFIGDVAVPARWTEDDRTWFDVDADMLGVARAVADAGVALARDVPIGDATCTGVDPRAASTVTLEHAPQIIIGGDGRSADPFGGRAFPCVPGGGDVFGCEPCRAQTHNADVPRFVSGATPFVDPNFFLDYFAAPPPSSTEANAEDMETAAVASVASRSGIPFIAFRAVSDGQGDPLGLPGFPFQFFYYRQIAADNAAAVTLEFLNAWSNH